MKASHPLLPILPLLVLLILGELLVRMEFLPSYLVAPPSEVAHTFVRDADFLWKAFIETLLCSVAGFLISAVLGVSIGVLLSSSEKMRNAFLPYAIFFQTVPIIAIAPLLVIWVGYGAPTVVTSALIVSVFPMIASTLAGIQSTDTALKDLFRLYQAKRLTTLFKLSLPFALPQIFVGLRVTAGLSVIGAIVGEFIAGGGLGGIIDVARTRQRVDQIFAALILASLIGLLLVSIVNRSSRIFLRHWHPSEVK